MKLSDLMAKIGACASNGETRRLLMNGVVKVNDDKVTDGDFIIHDGDSLKIHRNDPVIIDFSELEGVE